jgi:hypothetical protein
MVVWAYAAFIMPTSHVGVAAWQGLVRFRMAHPTFAQLPAQALAALSIFFVAQSLFAFVKGARSPGIKTADWAADACYWYFYLDTFLTWPIFVRLLSKGGRACILDRLYFFVPAWALQGAVAVLARVKHGSESLPSICHLN